MEILERFKQIISETQTPCILEFGACDGYHSRCMLDILQQTGKKYDYHLFEPSKNTIPNIVNLLKYYLSSYSTSVKLYNEAVGATVGKMKFYQSGGQKIENGQIKDNYFGSSSIRKPKLVTEAWKDMKFTETTCDVISFDFHIKRANFQNRVIDFVWADIQGAEVDLINGGKEYFKNVKYFYTEYANSEYYEGEIGLLEICKMLPDFEIVEDYGGDVLLRNTNLMNYKNLDRSIVVDTTETITPKKNEIQTIINYTPEQIFNDEGYVSFDKVRFEHFDTIGIDFKGKNILELGSGIGNHTKFLMSKKPKFIMSIEGRQDNFNVLKETVKSKNKGIFFTKKNISCELLDLENQLPDFGIKFDWIYNYGTLYHLKNPFEFIANLANVNHDNMILESCIELDGDVNNLDEDSSQSQSLSGIGSRPNLYRLVEELKKIYKDVYYPEQPKHHWFDIHNTVNPPTLKRIVIICKNKY
jgi:2-O-methyltransferase